MKRCSACRWMYIFPDFDLCEACEVHECPGCGTPLGALPGFCEDCFRDGTKTEVIAASKRWVGEAMSVQTVSTEPTQYQADCDQCDWKGDLRYAKSLASSDSFLHRRREHQS